MNWFPTASQYELNLDWILSQVKRFAKVSGEMETSAEDIQHAVDTAEEAKDTADEALAMISQAVTVTPSNTDPEMDGTAAPGIADTFARGDHIHPTDTSRASAVMLTATRNDLQEVKNILQARGGAEMADANEITPFIPQIYIISASTLHSPARDNVTLAEDGILISYAVSNYYAVEFALMAGAVTPYIRVKNGSETWTTWQQVGGV